MKITKFRTTSTQIKAALLALCASMIASPAFAQSTDFDGASIVAKITGFVAAGALILTAWYLGKWGLKAFGMLGAKS